jgi:hypothetical protein
MAPSSFDTVLATIEPRAGGNWRALEVGLDLNAGADAAHIALYTEFDSREALDAYQDSPEHMAVVPFVRAARTERRVVDYEV